MELIKLDNDCYINPERIAILAPSTQKPGFWVLALSGTQPIQISAAAASYLLTVIDIDNAFAGDIESAIPLERTLASRIASYLQNQASGVHFEDIESAMLEQTGQGTTETEKALNELLAQGTVRYGPNNTFLHATHAAPSVEW